LSVYYKDEQITLYNDDCLEIDAWLKADVLVTDPPYGIGWQPMQGMYQLKKQIKAPQIEGDDSTCLRDAALSLWGNKPRIVFGSWRARRPDPVDHRLIWHKKGQQPGPCNAAFMSQDEEIYVTGTGFRRSAPPLRSVITTHETRHHAVMKAAHPTPKPVQLMETLVDRCPAGIIADPFAGSGSTLIAARNLGRRAIGVEMEERYCELIAKRLDQMCLDFGA
jgi:hypothetical protein